MVSLNPLFWINLKGKKTWTAADADLDQHLIIDLGQVMNITRIWTQGRPHTSDYVMEYIVSYGTDNLDYSYYKEPGGSIRVRKNVFFNFVFTFLIIIMRDTTEVVLFIN